MQQAWPQPQVSWAQLLALGTPDASEGPAWRGAGTSTETGHFAKKGQVWSVLPQEAGGDLILTQQGGSGKYLSVSTLTAREQALQQVGGLRGNPGQLASHSLVHTPFSNDAWAGCKPTRQSPPAYQKTISGARKGGAVGPTQQVRDAPRRDALAEQEVSALGQAHLL